MADSRPYRHDPQALPAVDFVSSGDLTPEQDGTAARIPSRATPSDLARRRYDSVVALTVALGKHLTVEAIADVVVHQGVQALDAAAGALALLSPDGSQLEVVASVGYDQRVLKSFQSFSVEAALPLADAVRTCSPIYLESPEARHAQYQQLTLPPGTDRNGAWAALPLAVDGRPYGAIGLSFRQPRAFGPEDRALLELIARQCAGALDRERQTALDDQARQKAEAARQQMITLFEQAPALIAVLRGRDHVFDIVNPLFLRTVGREDPEHLLGKPLREALPEVEGQEYVEILDEVYRSGNPFIGQAIPVEINRRGGGARERIFVNFVCQPLRSESGAIEGIFVHAVDITDQVNARQQAEEFATKLAIERERLALAQAAARIGTFEWNLLDGWITWTAELEALYGLSSGGFRGAYEQWAAALHPDDRVATETIVQQAARDGQDFSTEFRIVWSDGSVHYLAARAQVFRDASGKPARMVGINMDITDRKLAEQAAARRHRLTALSADVGAALTQLGDLDSMLQKAAEAIVEHLEAAFARIWILSDRQQVLELRASAGLYTHRDGAHSRIPVGSWKIGRIASERAPHLTNDVQHDDRISDPDWARREGMVAFAGYPLIVEDRLVGVMGLFSKLPLSADVLDGLASIAQSVASAVLRKWTEEALEEETETLEIVNRIGQTLTSELDQQRLVQSVTDAATTLTDAQFGAFFYNVIDQRGEAYTLYTISGVPHDAFSRFPMPRNTAVFAPTFRGEEIVRLDDVTQDPRYGKNPPYHGMPAGHLPVRSYLAVPVVSRSGAVIGGLFFGHSDVGVFTDRSERIAAGLAAQAAIAMDNARLYQEAQRSIQIRDEFLSSVAHDLKTPLAGVKGQAQLLQRRAMRIRVADEQLTKIRDGLTSIDVAATRMTSLINGLLDITRLQLGQPLDLDRRPVDLGALARQVVRTLQLTTRQHRVRLETEGEAIVGLWDEGRLERVLNNLVGNAIKYSPGGGNVTIRLTTEQTGAERWAVLSVQDHGIGIPASDLPNLFTRFRRGANVIGRIEGTGIGLATSRFIVESHGGSITVQSAEGEGSTFTIGLPLPPV